MYKNLKTWLIRACVGSVMFASDLKADNTNPPTLSMNNSTNVSINQTTQARLYSLQAKTNLLNDAWNEVANSRGTESNLVFNINNSEPTKFFKVVGTYEPIYPTILSTDYSHYPHQAVPTYKPLTIINYETNALDVNISFTNIFNPYMFIYTTNIDPPLARTLTPGTNIVDTYVFWTPSGTGGGLFGDIIVNRVE